MLTRTRPSLLKSVNCRLGKDLPFGQSTWKVTDDRRSRDFSFSSLPARPRLPEMRDLFQDHNMRGWGPEVTKRRPEITVEMKERILRYVAVAWELLGRVERPIGQRR